MVRHRREMHLELDDYMMWDWEGFGGDKPECGFYGPLDSIDTVHAWFADYGEPASAAAASQVFICRRLSR